METSWSGVRGMLFLEGSWERVRCVFRMRAVVLCSLGVVSRGVIARLGNGGRWEGRKLLGGNGARRNRGGRRGGITLLSFGVRARRISFVVLHWRL